MSWKTPRIASINMPISNTIEEIAAAQRVDEELPKILESKELQFYTSEIRPYIPADLRKHIIHMAHNMAHPSCALT